MEEYILLNQYETSDFQVEIFANDKFDDEKLQIALEILLDLSENQNANEE